MKRALPTQLARARFTQLEITLSSVEQREGKTVTIGRLEARAQEINGEKRGNISGSYAAFWTQTPEGWRLSRDDATFNSLTQASLWEVAPAATSFPLAKTSAGLPRQNPAIVLEQAHRGQVESIAWSPDGKVLATYDFYDKLRFSSAQSGAFQKAMRTPMAINSMSYAPDGTLVTGHNDGKVRLWDIEKGTQKRELEASKWSVYSVQVSPDGRTLAADGAGRVQLWDIESGRKTRELGDTQGNVRSLDFSPDGKMTAFTSSAGVELWDIALGKRLQLVPNATWNGFSPDGATFAVSSLRGLEFHNTRDGALQRKVAVPNPFRHSIPQDGLPVSRAVYAPDAQLSPDFRTAASLYEDGSIGIWDVQTGKLKQQLRGFQRENVTSGDVSQIAWSPDGSRLAVGSRGGEVAVWNVK